MAGGHYDLARTDGTNLSVFAHFEHAFLGEAVCQSVLSIIGNKAQAIHLVAISQCRNLDWQLDFGTHSLKRQSVSVYLLTHSRFILHRNGRHIAFRNGFQCRVLTESRSHEVLTLQVGRQLVIEHTVGESVHFLAVYYERFQT